MREKKEYCKSSFKPPVTSSLLKISCLLVLSVSVFAQAGWCESMFRGGVSRMANASFTPHSLFTQPKPQNIGDVITITINQNAQVVNQSQLNISRESTIDENTTGMLNNIMHNLGVPKHWNLPSFDGMDNSNALKSTAQANQTNQLTDTISCQVVQILPNGYLVIQGHKTVMISKERQDMMVTGIVNPFYLNRFNEIESSRVANLQVLNGGSGVLSRQQNDGLANKYSQFFN